MGRTIFICYRREDAAAAGWLYDLLKGTFGHEQLFMDVDSIPFGEDFVAVLGAQSPLATCCLP